MKQCIYVKKFNGSNSLVDKFNYLRTHYPLHYSDDTLQVYDISSLGTPYRFCAVNIREGLPVGMTNLKYQPIEAVKFGGF